MLGAVVKDTLTGQSIHIEAKTVVNATGNYVDQIRRLDSPESVPFLQAQIGSHIVINKPFSMLNKGTNIGLYIPRTYDGKNFSRIFLKEKN